MFVHTKLQSIYETAHSKYWILHCRSILQCSHITVFVRYMAPSQKIIEI